MKLNEIQQKLKAPKNQFNKFGNYKYRSCEDILEAVKPLLGESTLILSDSIENLGERFYVACTAIFREPDGQEITVKAYARESESKKGMDSAQITGAASSYARKYALNGLFLIDDNKDPDTSDNRQEAKKTMCQNSKADTIKSMQWFLLTYTQHSKSKIHAKRH
jgi:hypothetical protein